MNWHPFVATPNSGACSSCGRGAAHPLHQDPMRVLESLTPGGSEFVGDPQRCAETIRETRASLMRVLVDTKRRHDLLQAQVKDFSQALVAMTWKGYGRSSDYLEGFRAAKDEALGLLHVKVGRQEETHE